MVEFARDNQVAQIFLSQLKTSVQEGLRSRKLIRQLESIRRLSTATSGGLPSGTVGSSGRDSRNRERIGHARSPQPCGRLAQGQHCAGCVAPAFEWKREHTRVVPTPGRRRHSMTPGRQEPSTRFDRVQWYLRETLWGSAPESRLDSCPKSSTGSPRGGAPACFS